MFSEPKLPPTVVPEELKSSSEDRKNAEDVHQNMLKVLEEMSRNLKVDAKMYDIIARFVRTANQLIDKAARGDWHALDEARRLVRWMESNYHLVPHVLRQKIPRVIGADVPKTTEEWLIRMQPSSSWSKYRDVAITATITWTITEILTLSVLRVVHLI